MISVIKEKYKSKAVAYGNIWMYFTKTAKELVKECESNNINITALEAFKLSGNGIQPSQEHSIDFSSNESNWKKAIDFLSDDNNADYLYEVWYEGY